MKAAPGRWGAALKLSLIGAATVLAAAASVFAAPGVAGLTGAGLALIMTAIAVIDGRLLIIPNELSALALALGFLDLSLRNWSEMPAPALAALIRCAVMAMAFFGFRLGYRRLRGREGMGLGDVKLAGVAGVWLDWASLPIVVEIAALSALGFVLYRQVRARQPLDPLSKLPFGAFLAPAIWICWLLARLGN